MAAFSSRPLHPSAAGWNLKELRESLHVPFFMFCRGQGLHAPPGGGQFPDKNALLRSKTGFRLLAFRLFVLATLPSHFHPAAELIT